jgi:hypothetical protein
MYKHKNGEMNWNRLLQGLLVFAIVAIVIKSLGGGWWLFFVLPFFFGCGGWGWSHWHDEEETLEGKKRKNEDIDIV